MSKKEMSEVIESMVERFAAVNDVAKNGAEYQEIVTCARPECEHSRAANQAKFNVIVALTNQLPAA